MQTLVIAADGTPPDELRAWIRQGSTSVDTIPAAEISTYISSRALGVDRIVIWGGLDDVHARTLATAYGAAHGDAVEQASLFYVTRAKSPAPSGITASQCFVWPDDRDKLRMMLTV